MTNAVVVVVQDITVRKPPLALRWANEQQAQHYANVTDSVFPTFVQVMLMEVLLLGADLVRRSPAFFTDAFSVRFQQDNSVIGQLRDARTRAHSDA